MSGANNVRRFETVYGSVRAYMEANTWRTFNSTYGINYHQLSTSAAAGANPAPSANNRNGYVVSRDSILHEIRVRIRRNNTEAVSWEYDFFVMRAGVYTQIHRFIDATSATAPEQFSQVVDFQLLRDDILMMATRKVTGNATRRFGYMHWTFDII